MKKRADDFTDMAEWVFDAFDEAAKGTYFEDYQGNLIDYADVDDMKALLENAGTVDLFVEDLEDSFNDSEVYNVEIIGFGEAMEILSEDDPSLEYSLESASDMGFACDSLNSEVLASVFISEKIREEMTDILSDFKGILENDEGMVNYFKNKE